MTLPTSIFIALPWVQGGLIAALILISGIAWSFILWVVPVVKLNKSVSAILQMEETSRRGGVWLEPLNASFAASLAILALLSTQHPEPSEAAKWKSYASACVILVQVAWWERVLIFPLDDSIAAMKGDAANFQNPACTWLGTRAQAELNLLMDLWARRHAVRATLPLIAAMVALSSSLV